MNATGDTLVDFGGADPAQDAGAEVDADGFVVDFSEVPDQAGFAAIPRGIYEAQVDDCTFGMSQASGNPMWTFKFEVTDGEHARRKLFFHAVFAATSMPRTKKLLAVLAPELLTQKFSPAAIADGGILLGRQCRIRVDIRKYQGEDRNNVRDVLPATEGGASSADSFLG